MTFHQLEIFDAVAKQASITEAARKIKISQPSVSKQLRFLERECGVKLYVKFGRGIKITEEGRMVSASRQMNKLDNEKTISWPAALESKMIHENEGGMKMYQAVKPPSTVDRMPGQKPPSHAATATAG